MTSDDQGRRESAEPPTFPDGPLEDRATTLARLTRALIFRDEDMVARPEGKASRYRRMWRNTVVVVSAVAIVPLITVSLINYFLYRQSFEEEMTEPIERVAVLSGRSVHFFLEERVAAEHFILLRPSIEELYQEGRLDEIFQRLVRSYGGIVDVGLIDSDGIMQAYAGPYDLLGQSYRDQDWFGRMVDRDMYVSPVFLGHRRAPHFVIAIKRRDDSGREHILRATIDTEVLDRQLAMVGERRIADAFIIDREGVIQTRSRRFGPPLTRFVGAVPPQAASEPVIEGVELDGVDYVMAYSYVENSPFIVIILAETRELTRGWFAYQTQISILLGVSILAIILIIMSISSNWVSRIRHHELRREATLHKAEYNAKMASIGRLAAGVAHEINNPLAIINEKAGLLRDIIGMTEGMPRPEKLLAQVDSISNSVQRCKTITHRLLGFARHIDIKLEPVAIDEVIRDVIGFLEKEATHHGVKILMCVHGPLPTVRSDKGQLQQLFLNLVNNALDAVDHGGHIVIDASTEGSSVEVAVSDDGCGIPKEHLDRILEPFFTTKQNEGTGLGLSIGYGIVRKLHGRMTVESKVGEGTTFVIRLPVERDTKAPGGEE